MCLSCLSLSTHPPSITTSSKEDSHSQPHLWCTQDQQLPTTKAVRITEEARHGSWLRHCGLVQGCSIRFETLVQGHPSTFPFLSLHPLDDMVLMSRFVRDAMRMVRAASSGNELDV